ncbi:MAG: biotin--[acetyl-CoA-carboxylase] ligase [Candidatus Marinimicrobia bacterium]|nr:biotin--[acetyl-CoA-carboxylase] ligase [Candidatus Neomarinimicrobiota bacterium]
MILHPALNDIIHLKTVDSTNLELKRRRHEFQGKNILLLSDEQTAGQGQKGRKWESVSGLGLWMSLYLGSPHMLLHDLQLLSVYTGRIVHHTIAPLLDREMSLKWPNDIMCSGKKCGGILSEVQWQGNAAISAIVGVGINLNHQQHDFSPTIQETATSLQLEGLQEPDRTMLAQTFVNEFFQGLGQLDDGKKLATSWNQVAYMLNQTVVWETSDKAMTGQFSGINEWGEALIKIEGEIRVFHTGEIRLKSPLSSV